MKIKFSIALLVLALAVLASAQDASQILKPPPGHKVAIVIFEDLECPDCARAAPLMNEAVKTYKIPQVRHDFPLPMHPWARQAAVFAKYFDTKDTAKEKYGDEFRDYIFSVQPQITRDNLRSYAQKFADEHHLALPLFIDPDGKLEAMVQHDLELGQIVGIQHTPTIYVVSNAKMTRPFVEVVDRSQLFQIIDEMKKEAGDTGTTAEASRPARRTKRR